MTLSKVYKNKVCLKGIVSTYTTNAYIINQITHLIIL